MNANTTHKLSIGIEMWVTDGGARLDIGLFAPWEYMRLEDARGKVEGMKSHCVEWSKRQKNER
jgi:hypothetical protein